MAGIPARAIEASPLSRSVTRDGITVDVRIYRFAGINDAWTLEVIDSMSGQTVWDKAYADDQVAFDTFEDALDEHGMRSFVEQPVQH
ncbi:hypothetical protein [Methylobacterium sp. WL120]|uniref:hypothetical protein n=1 Tax=Methylobacterium sp. WL120 TaxID=2603887 RepID=UPI0011CB7DFA|nr:hypothetical protein [Methylobacterium sp. WL120]TXM65792.1 hypothetical protein FV229_14530 [Methylobacterium sp. WL120]